MGRAERPKPKFLASKLKKIRQLLGFNLEEMVVKLNCPDIALYAASIYEYEAGKREPPLPVILQYARLANIYVEYLIDDKLHLPDQLPANSKREFKN